MNTTVKKFLSACSAFVFCASLANGVHIGASNNVNVPFSIVASAEDNETTLPAERPTSSCSASKTAAASYNVPVYIYAKGDDVASMANEAVEHSAKLVVSGGKYYITIGFHPIKKEGLIGHLQKFYYYNMTSNEYYAADNETKENAKIEVTGDSRVMSFDDLDDDDESTYSEYISEVTFELPTIESDVICRVKVDAMGDTEQDAVLVFDYANMKSVLAVYLAERVGYAKSISNENDYYTSSSYEALQTQITTTETVFLTQFANNISMMKGAIRDLDNAISNLVVKDTILANGIYNVPIDFKIAESAAYDAYTYYSVTGESSEFLNGLFGSTAQITAEDGKYTLKITAQSDGDSSYYLYNLTKGDSGAASLNFGGSWSDVDYFGSTMKFICTGDYLQASFNNLYSPKDLIVKANVYSKNEQSTKAVNLTGTGRQIAIDIDWNGIIFIENLPLNKDDLDSKVRYANSRLSGDMSAYTDASVSAYQDAYENAKAINDDDTVTQATVDAAATSLDNAAAALEQKVSLAGYTAELADCIVLNYYLNISDELKSQSPSVKFTFGDAEPQVVAFDKAEYVESQGYKFTAKLDPKNMTDIVTAEVYVGDDKVPTTTATTKKLSTTLKAYADTIIANADNSYSAEAIAAAKAMLNYGGYSQVLFDYNTDNLANASIDTDVSSVTADTLTDYKPTKSGLDDTAKFTGYNLYLDSLTSMRFYYTGDVEVSANAENYTTGTSDSKNYVEITDITPANLLTGYDVTIGGMTIHASPASYAHTALTKSSDENLQNAMKAMILYSQAAVSYDASLNN